jgi:hypothetical protein
MIGVFKTRKLDFSQVGERFLTTQGFNNMEVSDDLIP